MAKLFQVIIIPSSNDEVIARDLTITQLKRCALYPYDSPIESAVGYSFSTEAERDAFLLGYKSNVGYFGNGFFVTCES